MERDKQGVAVIARNYFRRYLIFALGMFMFGVVGGALLALNGHNLQDVVTLLQ